MSTTRLWSQQLGCHVCTNSTLSVPLLKSESEHICHNSAVTAWQTNFKVNHIYSYGSNFISAESVKKLLGKFQTPSNPDWLPRHKLVFSNCVCVMTLVQLFIPLVSLMSTVAWASSSRDSSSVVPVRAAWCRAEKLWGTQRIGGGNEGRRKREGGCRRVKQTTRSEELYIKVMILRQVRPF